MFARRFLSRSQTGRRNAFFRRWKKLTNRSPILRSGCTVIERRLENESAAARPPTTGRARRLRLQRGSGPSRLPIQNDSSFNFRFRAKGQRHNSCSLLPVPMSLFLTTEKRWRCLQIGDEQFLAARKGCESPFGEISGRLNFESNRSVFPGRFRRQK
jgi:hypothetical protein